MNTPSASADEIVLYDGTLQNLGSGKFLRFLLEENGVIYLNNLKIPDSTSILLIHTNYNVLEDINIAQSPFPITAHATVMFENEFTFPFRYTQSDADALKLTGSPSAGLEETQLELDIYPNPIHVADIVTIRALRDGEVQLISSSGNVLKRFDIVNGEAHLNTSFLISGVYFILFMNHTQRIVVN